MSNLLTSGLWQKVIEVLWVEWLMANMDRQATSFPQFF